VDSIKTALENGRQKLTQLKKRRSVTWPNLSSLKPISRRRRIIWRPLQIKLTVWMPKSPADPKNRVATDQLHKRQQVMGQRLRAIYKQPNPSLVQIILIPRA